jgi:hypothetical protein
MILKSVLTVLMISDPCKNLVLHFAPGTLHLVILVCGGGTVDQLNNYLAPLVILLDLLLLEELLILESWICGSSNDRWTF